MISGTRHRFHSAVLSDFAQALCISGALAGRAPGPQSCTHATNQIGTSTRDSKTQSGIVRTSISSRESAAWGLAI